MPYLLSRWSELSRQLIGREIKSRYKQSFLGYAWVILNPLLQMLVMTFVFSLIIRVSSLGVPYAIFLYVALLPWNLFANSLTHATNSLVGNAALIKKIYFPRQIFIQATLIAKIVDFLLASLVLVAFFLYYHLPLTLNVLWVIPIFIIQEIFTYGLSLILAAANLFYRDVQHLLSLILVLWMYVTPIIYPIEMVPEAYRFVFKLNPMAVIVNAYRECILGGNMPKLSSLGIALIVSLATYYLGRKIFIKLEGYFADVA
ncbi:MAG: ABC transporter permease [bacterium]